MSKMTPLQEVVAIHDTKSYSELYDVLTEVEEKLTVEISTDWVNNNKGILSGSLNFRDKDSSKFLGNQEFDLAGVKNLSEYFANLLIEFKI